MKAVLTNYRQSPRKVRLVAGLIKGKKVSDALVELSFLSKKASLPVKKLIESAVANAVTNFKQDKDNLYIKSLVVDKGMVMGRFIPGARGTAYPINRRSSIISVVLDIKPAEEKAKSKKKSKAQKAQADKPVKIVKKAKKATQK